MVVLQLYSDMAHAVGGFLLTVARQWMTSINMAIALECCVLITLLRKTHDIF